MRHLPFRKLSQRVMGEPLVQTFLNEASKYPLLTAEEEKALSRLYHSGTETQKNEARAKFVNSNLRLVATIAYYYSKYNPHIPLSDLIQEGNIGLMKAVEKFDPDRGFKFSTYASWWIRQGITRSARMDKPIHIPIYQIERQYQIRKLSNEAISTLGRPLTTAEICEMTGLTEKQVETALSTRCEMTSMESPIGDEDGDTFGSRLRDDTAKNPEEEAIEQNVIWAVGEFLEGRLQAGEITQRDLDMVRMRYDFWSTDQSSLQKIGDEMGVTRERVRQIVSKQLQKMQKELKRKFNLG